jgi:hypothetical protein
MAIGGWDFQNIDDVRRAKLEEPGSFEETAEQVRDTMEVLCCHRMACERADGFARPVYTIKVTAYVFDRFFNSRSGYRAEYFRSPFGGLAANGHLLRTIAPALVASNQPDYGSSVDPALTMAPLTSHSAKVWLTEQNAFCDRCKGEWRSTQKGAEIINGRWELSTLATARDGRMAPALTKLKVMGAFLSNDGDEFIPYRKRRRHFEIHETGWS